MFGKFTWKEESDSSLDFPRRDGALLVHLGQFGRLGGEVKTRHRLFFLDINQ